MAEDITRDPNQIIPLTGMYKDYFLDYASYVILERAVPLIEDGCKPVQRRILHSMKDIDDGRYNKVANIIGHTMQYHPHGDASIGDALVNMGQKDLLIDCQGNWGDNRTGDSAAAPRYIEARLTKFALDVVFNPDTTLWQTSYDGRKKEPVFLPVKFPLLLSQGTEGIAVGLTTKILPHNFNELLDACVSYLEEQPFTLYPDFLTGGYIDVSNYNSGQRGGKILSRAKINIANRNQLEIVELPFGTTTDRLIESILKANDKGQIKIKKIVDNTAKDVNISIELMPGISPDQTIDALYRFSDCESSISTMSCVIIDNKPVFLPVEDILKANVDMTKELLRMELQIKLNELLEKWFFTSLEKIFIEQRIYRDIEEAESFEQVLTIIEDGLLKYVSTPSHKTPGERLLAKLPRDISQDDIVRLTEIKIKKISKYSSFETDKELESLQEEIKKVRHNLDHLVSFTIDWFKYLKEKYGKDRNRKSVITQFEAIEATAVVQNNSKLYVNREEGFIGFGLKKDEFVSDCSDIDDIIVFTGDGKMVVSRLAEKTFIGKNIIHVAVWKKNDDRTTYNLIYSDGPGGKAYAKRFNVTAITRDKEYDLTKGAAKPKVHYFSANENGEAEVLKVTLSPVAKAKIKVFDFDFATQLIKGRDSLGNIVTKYPIRKITLLEKGGSTLGAQVLYLDEETGKLNVDNKGRLIGNIDNDDKLLIVYQNGTLELTPIDFSLKLNPKEIALITKYNPDVSLCAVHFDGHKGWTMVKRFKIESDAVFSKFQFISDHPDSSLLYITTDDQPLVKYSVKVRNNWVEDTLDLNAFIEIKGWKAIGNKLSSEKLKNFEQVIQEKSPTNQSDKVNIGDTIEFDIESGQGSLF
ncbi:MAG: DNA gyrase/topoisomerase IV subunit A [Saprospiraceae bacterium]|nr:DNA gyrase/topoisomerase IV subunit A [Saprospiraceae bacterium]